MQTAFAELCCKVQDVWVWCAEERQITETGFQFLLLDTYSQLWRLLREYIANGEEVSGLSMSCNCLGLMLLPATSRACAMSKS